MSSERPGVNEPPEREVLFMPAEPISATAWRWEPDAKLRWWAPAFNALEHDALLHRTELDVGSWKPPLGGCTCNRLLSIKSGESEISAAAATGMTILRILSRNGAAGSEDYHKHAEFLSPLSALLRRLSFGDVARFEQGLRDYVRDHDIRLQVLGNRKYVYLIDDGYYTGTPWMLFTQASLLLHALFICAGYSVQCEGSYYHLTGG